MSKLKEIWKSIPGYVGFYEASNLGNVRSLNYRRTGNTHLLKERLKADGTVLYLLHIVGPPQPLRADRLVWEAFNGPVPAGHGIVHIDKNPKNNCLNNLGLLTYDDIILHTDEKKQPKKQPKSVLQCDPQGNVIQEWPSVGKAAEANGFTSSRPIHRCLKGESPTARGFVWKYNKPAAQAPEGTVLRIQDIVDLKKFERMFTDKKFRAYIRNKDWERFDRRGIPKQVHEIAEIGYGKYKRIRTIDIDISEEGKDQLALCYIVYFARGKTSIPYKNNPLGFIVQSLEFRDRVLNTRLRIKEPDLPSRSIDLLKGVKGIRTT